MLRGFSLTHASVETLGLGHGLSSWTPEEGNLASFWGTFAVIEKHAAHRGSVFHRRVAVRTDAVTRQATAPLK